MGITSLEDGLFANLMIFDYYTCPRMSQNKFLYGERVSGVGVDGG